MINPKEKYFLILNKKKPIDLGLKPASDRDYFIDENNQKWEHEYFWENIWGVNEKGFIRLPKPSFEQLWILLTESNIENNKLGAAELLNRDYPFELKEKLNKLFKNTDRINRGLTKRLSLLELLNYVMNRSDLHKASPEKVNSDYQEWRNLKSDFDKLKTESLWKRIKKL